MQLRIAQCALVCLLVALTSAGCDDTVIDPFENDGKIFSVFGYLDAFAFEQKVRVIPVTRFPERIRSRTDPQANIDASVQSVDLETGQVVHWNHSLEQLDNGLFAHIFTGDFEPREGHEYRLTVSRNDGRTATAETKVPHHFDSTPIEFDPESIRQTTDPSRVPVQIRGIGSVGRIIVRYRVSATDTVDIALEKRIPMDVSYGATGRPDGNGGWRFLLNIPRDGQILAERIAELQADRQLGPGNVHVFSMTIQIQGLDDQWIPLGDDADAVALSQPGVFSNIENGYGFWGALSSILQDFELGPSYNSAFGF